MNKPQPVKPGNGVEDKTEVTPGLVRWSRPLAADCEGVKPIIMTEQISGINLLDTSCATAQGPKEPVSGETPLALSTIRWSKRNAALQIALGIEPGAGPLNNHKRREK